MARLSALLYRGEDDASLGGKSAWYRLEFGHDGDGRGVISGAVTADLPLLCQRCFEVYPLKVETPISLALVAGLDEAKALPERYDPLLVEDRLIRPADLIEDELILAIPAIPRHAEGLCQRPALPVAEGEQGASQSDVEAGGRRRPFAVLASLRSGKGGNN
jgi:uncharacterized protein